MNTSNIALASISDTTMTSPGSSRSVATESFQNWMSQLSSLRESPSFGKDSSIQTDSQKAQVTEQSNENEQCQTEQAVTSTSTIAESKTAESAKTTQEYKTKTELDKAGKLKAAEADGSTKTDTSVQGSTCILPMMNGLFEKVKDVLVSQFGISKEQLEYAMQTLGQNDQDLLEPNQLAMLVTQINGGAGKSLLLLDEKLYQDYTEIMSKVDTIQQEALDQFGISKEELKGILKQVSTEPKQRSKESGLAVLTDLETQGNVQQSSSGNSDYATNVQDSKVHIEVNRSLDRTVGETNRNLDKIVDETSSGTQNMIKASVRKDNHSASMSPLDMAFHQFGLDNPDLEVSQNLNKEALNINLRDLIEQVAEQVKVTLQKDTSKLEIQLNPEHLGRMTIQVAVKDGAVTAFMTAQNQVVKEALESQMIQLREKLDTQGLKVDAIEVMVESHSFESRFDQNNENSNHNAKQQTSQRRQLNINELGETIYLGAEEELLADMMVGNGNSIDYTA